MNIVFVVLHYENLVDTRQCLDSLLKYIDSDNAQIVAVDNGSKSGRLDMISNEYNNASIHFIYSKDNLGFAKGNNLGFKFAKVDLSADIIILANNDLVFKQDDFVKQIIAHYKKDKFDVAGPRIISLVDGKNQNPVPVQYKTLKDINIRIIKYCILYFLSILGMDTVIQKRVAKEIMEYHPVNGEDFQLHGACMMFSNEYMRKFDGLCAKTFMYNEEGILKEMVIKNNMNMQYFDDIEVWHKEGASTQATHGMGKKKRQFYYKWNIHSCRVLKRLKSGVEGF